MRLSFNLKALDGREWTLHAGPAKGLTVMARLSVWSLFYEVLSPMIALNPRKSNQTFSEQPFSLALTKQEFHHHLHCCTLMKFKTSNWEALNSQKRLDDIGVPVTIILPGNSGPVSSLCWRVRKVSLKAVFLSFFSLNLYPHAHLLPMQSFWKMLTYTVPQFSVCHRLCPACYHTRHSVTDLTLTLVICDAKNFALRVFSQSVKLLPQKMKNKE